MNEYDYDFFLGEMTEENKKEYLIAGNVLKYGGLSLEIDQNKFIDEIARNVIKFIKEIEEPESFLDKENFSENYSESIELADESIKEEDKKESISIEKLMCAGAMLIYYGFDVKKYAPIIDGKDNDLYKMAIYSVIAAKAIFYDHEEYYGGDFFRIK